MKVLKLNKEFFITTTAIVVGGFALGLYFFGQVEAKSVATSIQEEASSQDYVAPEAALEESACQGGCGCGK